MILFYNNNASQHYVKLRMTPARSHHDNSRPTFELEGGQHFRWHWGRYWASPMWCDLLLCAGPGGRLEGHKGERMCRLEIIGSKSICFVTFFWRWGFIAGYSPVCRATPVHRRLLERDQHWVQCLGCPGRWGFGRRSFEEDFQVFCRGRPVHDWFRGRLSCQVCLPIHPQRQEVSSMHRRGEPRSIEVNI